MLHQIESGAAVLAVFLAGGAAEALLRRLLHRPVRAQHPEVPYTDAQYTADVELLVSRINDVEAAQARLRVAGRGDWR